MGGGREGGRDNETGREGGEGRRIDPAVKLLRRVGGQ